MDTKKIGTLIAVCRKEKGMTQAELGERLGVTNKTVSRWENGHYMPDLSLLEPLSKALDLSLEELLAGERLPEAPQAAAESRLQDVVDYSSQLLRKGRRWFSCIMLVLGVFAVLLGLDGQGRTAALALALGWGMVGLGAWQALRHHARLKQIVAVGALVIATSGSFLFVDYKMVTVIICRRNFPCVRRRQRGRWLLTKRRFTPFMRSMTAHAMPIRWWIPRIAIPSTLCR